jgi:hypothetical protein
MQITFTVPVNGCLPLGWKVGLLSFYPTMMDVLSLPAKKVNSWELRAAYQSFKSDRLYDDIELPFFPVTTRFMVICPDG